MKKIELDVGCAYLMKHYFADIGKIIRISLRTLKRDISNPSPFLEKLVEDGYLQIIERGQFRKGSTRYKVLNAYPHSDITAFEDSIAAKTLKQMKRTNDVSGIRIPVFNANTEQQSLIDSINAGCYNFKIQHNGRVSTNFSNLDKSFRKLASYNGEPFVEIDINATIPRLLAVFLKNHCKEWVGDKASIHQELEEYQSLLANGKDAYTNLMERFGLTMARSEFKQHLLTVIFGSVKNEPLRQDIISAFRTAFPNMYGQITKFAKTYRRARNDVQSYKSLLFAQNIFTLESRIINNAVKNLDCKKFTVFDSVNVPAANVEQAIKAIQTSWNKVTGDSSLLVLNVNGVARYASQSVSANAPTDDINRNIFGPLSNIPHCVEGGEGEPYRLGRNDSLEVQKLRGPKRRNVPSNINQLADGRFTTSIKGKKFKSRKGETKEDFAQRMTQQPEAEGAKRSEPSLPTTLDVVPLASSRVDEPTLEPIPAQNGCKRKPWAFRKQGPEPSIFDTDFWNVA